MRQYDYLIVGAGLFGCVFAHCVHMHGKTCLVVDRRPHIGGNCFTEAVDLITVHRYGAHIFHTNNKAVWDYMSRFAAFNRFTNSPVANYHGEVYSLPFNMYTFNKMWGVVTPQEAAAKIAEQRRAAGICEPKNLEEQTISLVGLDIYEKLVKGYTEKQWGRPCRDLPASIIKRIPVRFTYDNNYFNSQYQGIPIGGYTPIFSQLLRGTDVILNTDYLLEREKLNPMAKRVLFTGCIDEYYDRCYGALDYRSVRFDTVRLESADFQGNAVVNYTAADVPYTRIIEHKHFEGNAAPHTIISYEYSVPYEGNAEPSYPLTDSRNQALYEKYRLLSQSEKKVIFGGRLGMYRYMDMDEAASEAINLAKKELN